MVGGARYLTDVPTVVPQRGGGVHMATREEGYCMAVQYL